MDVTHVQAWMGFNIIKDLRNDMFSKIQESNCTFLDDHPTGDLLARNTSDINLLKQFLATQLEVFVRQGLTLVGAILIIIYVSPIVALYTLWTVPVIFAIMFWYRTKIRPNFFQSREIYGEVTSVLDENIMGMRVVRAFAQEDREIKKFTAKNTKYFKKTSHLILLDTSFEPLVRFFANLSMVIIVFTGTRLIATPGSGLEIGALFSLILLINFAIDPLFFISRFLADMSKIGATSDRVTQILLNNKKETDSGLPDLPIIHGEVEFDDVYFSYRCDDHYELKGISFKTQPGEKIAILGATGSGKFPWFV